VKSPFPACEALPIESPTPQARDLPHSPSTRATAPGPARTPHPCGAFSFQGWPWYSVGRQPGVQLHHGVLDSSYRPILGPLDDLSAAVAPAPRLSFFVPGQGFAGGVAALIGPPSRPCAGGRSSCSRPRSKQAVPTVATGDTSPACIPMVPCRNPPSARECAC
jgi:hypothetical protein